MNEHRRFQELSARAIDGAIPAADAGRLAAHLGSCAACRRFAAGFREDDELARGRSRPHAPATVREAVVTAALHRSTLRPARPLVPVLGAVVVALVLLAGLGLVGRLRAPGPAQLPTRSWTPLGGSPFSDILFDALGTGSQLIVSGIDGSGGIRRSAIWMSPDGVVWTRLPADAMYTGGAGEILASNGDTLVVLGESYEHSPGGAPAPQAWLTHAQRICDLCSAPPPPGNPWQSAGPMFSQGSGTMIAFTAMVSGGVGFVAVGGEFPFPLPGPVAPFGARVATSGDGSTWTLGDPTAPEFIDGSMVGVAAGPAGVVAVGDVGVAATAWFSSDGRTWTRLPGVISPTTASLRGVAAGPSGFVAVGDEGGHGIAWVSADGRSWRSSPASAALEGARMLSVRWLGSEYVATGETANGDGVAWHSADGLSWSRFDTGSIFAGASVQRAVSIGSRYVLFGTDTTDPSAQVPRNVVAVGDVPGQP